MKRLFKFILLIGIIFFQLNQGLSGQHVSDSLSHTMKWEELASVIATFSQPQELTTAIPFIQGQIEDSKQKGESLVGEKELFLGRLYISLGQYDSALQVVQSAQNSFKKHQGQFDTRFIKTFDVLAEIYQIKGDFEKAKLLQRAAIQRTNALSGSDDSTYQSFHHNLGVIFLDMGRYKEAIKVMKETVAYAEKTKGKNDPTYFSRASHLGFAYGNIGQYDKALGLYRESVELAAQIMGKEHTLYAARLEGLAQLYMQMELYELAITNFEEVLSIFSRSMGESHYRIGTLESRLGLAHYNLGQYPEAFEHFQVSRKILKETLGIQNLNYGLTLTNIAVLYRESDRLAEALPLQQEAVDIAEKTVGTSHLFYGRQLAVLAGIYRRMKAPNSAITQYKKALNTTGKALGKEHPENWTYLMGLALSYEILDEMDSSLHYYIQANDQILSRLDKQFDQFSEQEQEGLFLALKEHQGDILSFNLRHPEANQLINLSLDNDLMIRGLMLKNRKQLLAAAQSQEEGKLNLKLEEWKYLQSKLAQQYSLPLNQRTAKIEEMENKANQLESELSMSSVDFKKAQRMNSWKDIQAQLGPNEAAISFSQFSYSNAVSKIDSTCYIAYIIRPDSPEPIFTFISTESRIRSYLEVSKTSSANNSQANLYTSRGVRPKQKTSQPQADPSIYELIWKPLTPFLTNTKRIHFSPSGLLHRINLSALPFDNTKRLIDKWELHQVGSLQQLIDEKNIPNKSELPDIWVYGGITYHSDSTHLMVQPNLFASSFRGGNLQDWQYLPATHQEAQEIAEMCKKAGMKTTVLTGVQATEASIKTLGKSSLSPRILHLATHGYFFQKNEGDQDTLSSDQIAFQLSSRPLIRSGLILAGANHAWAGNPIPEGQEDGILTAYEISQMNLSNTELVVLSACETGLGDIEGNEGVYGLQRAFKIAGAKYILMSLWQVPDQATQELMTAFYEKWLSGMEIREAFRSAQKKMRSKYKDPYFWAGFVLTE